jgi:hypothetical protein
MANRHKVIKEFKRIKSMGYIKSRRKNDTGIGKTFEDYLGVDENNLKDPDFAGYEIKSHRKSSSSYVTLFTKSPSKPKKANSLLREKFGTPEGKLGVKTIRTSVFSNKWNTYQGEYSFRITVNRSSKTIDLISKPINNKKITVECSWDFSEIKTAFSKLKSLFFVTAEREKKRIHEYFHYTNATIFNQPTFEKLICLIENGKMMVDIRLGVYSSGRNQGKAHDHGTGFRIKSDDLSQLYKDVIDVS